MIQNSLIQHLLNLPVLPAVLRLEPLIYIVIGSFVLLECLKLPVGLISQNCPVLPPLVLIAHQFLAVLLFLPVRLDLLLRAGIAGNGIQSRV